jgi:hypothetical protein
MIALTPSTGIIPEALLPTVEPPDPEFGPTQAFLPVLARIFDRASLFSR